MRVLYIKKVVIFRKENIDLNIMATIYFKYSCYKFFEIIKLF
jgi:hypothetical protein